MNGYLQSCPLCGNETDYTDEAEADEDWQRWRKRFLQLVRLGVRRVFDR